MELKDTKTGQVVRIKNAHWGIDTGIFRVIDEQEYRDYHGYYEDETIEADDNRPCVFVSSIRENDWGENECLYADPKEIELIQ